MLEKDPIAEAVTVLTSRGHTVEPDDNFEHWRVDGGEPITAGDPITALDAMAHEASYYDHAKIPDYLRAGGPHAEEVRI
jgi:hypothetical protein